VRPTGALAGDHSSSQLDSLSGGLGKPDGAHRAPAGLGPCQRTRRGRAVTTGGLEPPGPSPGPIKEGYFQVQVRELNGLLTP
jgi:hypothetical protein